MAVEYSWEPAMENTPDRDYAWRVHVPRVIWGEYLLKKSEELDYGNFKSHCSEKWNSEERNFCYERLQLLHESGCSSITGQMKPFKITNICSISHSGGTLAR